MGRGRRGDCARIRRHQAGLGVPWTDTAFPTLDTSIGLHKVQL